MGPPASSNKMRRVTGSHGGIPHLMVSRGTSCGPRGIPRDPMGMPDEIPRVPECCHESPRVSTESQEVPVGILRAPARFPSMGIPPEVP